jgi:hypothetical protein
MRTHYELYLDDLADPPGFVRLLIEVLSKEIECAHVDLWWPPKNRAMRDQIERMAASVAEVDVLMNSAAAKNRLVRRNWLEIELDLTRTGIGAAAPLLSMLLPVAVSARLGLDEEVGTELISVIQYGERRNLGVWLAADEATEIRRRFAGLDDIVL